MDGKWRVIDRLSIDHRESPLAVDFESKFDTHIDAYLSGRRFACCRGAVSVKVIAPDGAIAHEWRYYDEHGRVDNRWFAHLPHPV